MEFLPLKQAFGEYCRKALCSEVCLETLGERVWSEKPRRPSDFSVCCELREQEGDFGRDGSGHGVR